MRPRPERTVLAVIDFSLSSNYAACRAAQVASEHGATLALLHVLQADGEGQRRDAPLAAARTQLERLGQRLQKQYGIEVSVRATRGDPLRQVVHAARDAHLLVIGSRGRNTLAEFLLGTPAERIIRMARVPALVVKREASGPYQNILAPVALSQEAHALVAAALEFLVVPTSRCSTRYACVTRPPCGPPSSLSRCCAGTARGGPSARARRSKE